LTITGDKGGPGDGACAFPHVAVAHPPLHVGLGGVGGFAGHGVGLGGLGFGGFGSFGTFGFRGLGHRFGFGLGHGFHGLGGLGGCPHSGFMARRRRRRDTETFDDAAEGAEGNPDQGSKPTWAIKRWFAKARDFLMAIAQASQEDEGKGGWSIPIGNFFN